MNGFDVVSGCLAPKDELKLTTAISKVQNAPLTTKREEFQAMKAEFLRLVQELGVRWRKDVGETIKYLDQLISPTREKAPGWNHAELRD